MRHREALDNVEEFAHGERRTITARYHYIGLIEDHAFSPSYVQTARCCYTPRNVCTPQLHARLVLHRFLFGLANSISPIARIMTVELLGPENAVIGIAFLPGEKGSVT